MIQYYQLTPEILLEYIYENDSKLNDDGIKGNEKEMFDSEGKSTTMLLKSNAFGSKYFCFVGETEELNRLSNLVLPLNNTETQFVVAQSEYQNFYSKNNASNIFSLKNGKAGYIYEDTKYDKNINNNESCDVKYDKCIAHFTSRNYFENYDSLIFQAYAYLKDKSKIYLASFLFKKTSNLELKAEHMLYNEKLYTAQIEFDIPSVFDIFLEKNKKPENKLPFVAALESQNIDLMENTPIVINVYGVSGSVVGIDNYERLNTRKINSIYIPYVYNRLDEIQINIAESELGDYYEISPKMGSGYSSFVDYIEHMGEDIHSYIVMHELCLRETWVDNNGNMHTKNTHKEVHIIDINEDDEDDEIVKKFDMTIKYRPICMHSGDNCIATILDTIKVINTVDSSLYEVSGSTIISNPHKYGKKLSRLFNSEDDSGNQLVRPIINVYNKKVSNENTSNNILALNKNKGFVVENNTQNITSFIECTNVGVSVVELSPEEM